MLIFIFAIYFFFKSFKQPAAGFLIERLLLVDWGYVQ